MTDPCTLAVVLFLAGVTAYAVWAARRADLVDPHHAWAVGVLRSVAHGLRYTDGHGLEVHRTLLRKVSARNERVPAWEVLWPGATDTVWYERREVLVDALTEYRARVQQDGVA